MPPDSTFTRLPPIPVPRAPARAGTAAPPTPRRAWIGPTYFRKACSMSFSLTSAPALRPLRVACRLVLAAERLVEAELRLRPSGERGDATPFRRGRQDGGFAPLARARRSGRIEGAEGRCDPAGRGQAQRRQRRSRTRGPVWGAARISGAPQRKRGVRNVRYRPDESRRLPGGRPLPGRLGPPGDRDRRDRDARSHGDPRGVREEQAAPGRAHLGLAPHDDPDRGAHRDAEGPRRRRALGLVQHLLDPGPRRRRGRRLRHRRLRPEGRVARRVLGLHPPHLRVARRRRHEHDPRRRRRRDPAAAPRREGGEGPLRPREPDERGGARPLRGHPEAPRREARLVLEAARVGPRRHRGDDDRRPSPLPDAREGRAEDPRHQRQRLRHQVEVRQPLRLPRVAGGRDQARDRRDDRGQDRGRLRLRRRGQGLGPGPARPLRPGLGDRDRPHLRPAGGDGGLPRGHDGLRLRQGRHLRDRHRQLPRDHPRPHGAR